MTVMEPAFLDRETVDRITIIGIRRAAVDVLLEYLGEIA